ncbi:hypothetical protein DFH88_002545, partial [Clostridium saccharobutylicum]|nr:hypothetical protein [Clostridium saccharobutylicum]
GLALFNTHLNKACENKYDKKNYKVACDFCI